jgi:hypothetical protein
MLCVNVPAGFYRTQLWRERLSRANPQNSLRYICLHLMGDMNYSPQAFEYYKRAEAMRLELPDLYHFLIRTAYRSHIEQVSRRAMEHYLVVNDKRDDNLNAYIFHMLLSAKNLAGLFDSHRSEALQFASQSLEAGRKGRYYYTLYAYFIVVGAEITLPADLMHTAETLVQSVLFTYRVRTNNPAARVIYVREKAKNTIGVYKLTNGSALVESCENNFNYSVLAADEHEVLDTPLKVTRLVTCDDPSLYSYFYRKGAHGFNLLYTLAQYIISEQYVGADAIDILSSVLSAREISDAFANQVKSTLGRLLYTAGRNEDALKYFLEADANTLPDSDIEDMLNAFISTKKWDSAARLIVKKETAITDRSLFAALKQLCKFPEYNDAIAAPAYRLLMKTWYDKALLDVVLKHYVGVQGDWQALSAVLDSISVKDKELDALILHTAVYAHELSEGAQRVFVRDTDNPASEEFTYFCVYEMIVNAFKPMYETLLFLEKIYLKTEEPFLAYALSHAYLQHDLSTPHSDAILAAACVAQETEDILFPVFKINKDKFSASAYIEKNQPFLYHSVPGKNVFLYYRSKDERYYHKRRMRYLRFGLYSANIAVFYGETIVYYFSEEQSTGSITTAEQEVQGTGILFKSNPEDPYYLINNAIIYEQMFQYIRAEEQLSAYLMKPREVNAKLL